MDELCRRHLLRAGAVTAASYSRILGANEKVRIAVIGTGSRGSGQVRGISSRPDAEVIGVCDVYRRKAEAARRFAPDAAVSSGHRKALELPSLDAVFVSTPDHWHVPIALDAIHAGKDVYCEKPVTLKIGEAAELQKAVRSGRRVFQSGMQQRSMTHWPVICVRSPISRIANCISTPYDKDWSNQ
jgi:predicted dehydrogenase